MKDLNLASLLSDDVTRDLEQARETAQHAEIRTLQDIEMGWIGGGDDIPTWPR
jgi:hypothetical protein